jgi:hypothetical protein
MPLRAQKLISPCLAVFVLCIFGSSLASAGPLSEAAAKAEAMQSSGDPAGAYTLMREAVSDFSATLPFSIGKAVFVTEPPLGYGIYTPRANSDFKASEPLISYIEPLGLTWKSADQAGKQQTKFTVDFDILDEAGDVLAGQKAFGSFSFTGLFRNQELFTHLKLDVSSAPPGKYTLRYTINDTNSGKSAVIDQPFVILP